MQKQFLFFILLIIAQVCHAQMPILNKMPKFGGHNSTKNKSDTSKSERDNTLGFEHRDDKNDSIAISFKYLDSIRNNKIDSSINDFDKYFSVPSQFQYLGNNGAAAYSLIYLPNSKPGWDAGFHAFDIYKFKLEDTKFYKTTKPLTQISYQLASGKEQMIKILHTQNPRPNVNFGFEYRLINAPGYFVTQNTNHKSYRFFSNYQGKKKRYANYFVLMGNAIKNAENGGIVNDTNLTNPNYKKRYTIPVNLGNANLISFNPFNTTISTGNIDKDFTIFMRHTYDLGKKDSIAINDSTTDYLFYPKLRLQYSFNLTKNNYLYNDFNADSTIYKNWYDTILKKLGKDTFTINEKWRIISNDLSLIQFPDNKNVAEFFLAGVTIENIKGTFYKDSIEQNKNFYNLILHGEYRNKTKNKKWDLLAKGILYLNGFNAGDYNAYATIGRFLNKKLGNVKVFFNNTNRTPSFVYNSLSSFNFSNQTLNKKENIITFGAEATNPLINLSFKNNIITNYCFFNNYYKISQSSKVINLLQFTVYKKVVVTKKINWYADVSIQQTDGALPIKVPLFYTRNRIAYEGILYKNLNLSSGVEVKYYTPYKAYNYSPAMGQFMPQDTFKLKNVPQINAYFHFRVKSFIGYLRTENLNTLSFLNGVGFYDNNFAAPHYPTQGLIIRFGILWNFVN